MTTRIFSPTALTLFLVISFNLLPFTAPAAPEPTVQETVNQKIQENQNDQTLWDLYGQGGFLMHFIALCSIGTIAVSAFCGVQINGRKMLPAPIASRLNHLMATRDVTQAFETCRSMPCALTNIVTAALVKVNFELDYYNKAAMEQAAEEALQHEETKLMLWINYLNAFATIAPMLGLLGTVTGLIQAFGELQAGHAEPSDLAGGIGEAMITTAAGLMVGIPAMFCFFFFRNNLLAMVANLQRSVTNMLDLFTGEISLEAAPSEPAQEQPQRPA